MSFVAGVNAGVNAREVRHKIQMDRDEQNFKLMQAGYVRNNQGGFDILPGGKAELEQMALDNQRQELEIQGTALMAMRNQLVSQDSFALAEEFSESGNANAVQKQIDAKPLLKEFLDTKDIKQIANIDFINDKELLMDIGVTDEMLEDKNIAEALRKNLWKTYNGENWQIGSLPDFVAQTGMLNKVSTARATKIRHGLAKFYAALQGEDLELEEQKVAIDRYKAETDRQELENKYHRSSPTPTSTPTSTPTPTSTSTPSSPEPYIKPTAKMRNTAAARRAEQKLIEAFGGEAKFWKTDFSKEENFRKASPHLSNIEALSNSKLSQQSRKTLDEVRQLIYLAKNVQNLSAKDIGLVDNFFYGIKQYLYNNTDNSTIAVSSYNAFRNVLLHAFAGSTMSRHEIKRFEEAFGTGYQRLGPVLTKFTTNLGNIKARLMNIKRNSNVYTTHIRLGTDLGEINNIIAAINERISYINGYSAKMKEENKDLYEFEQDKGTNLNKKESLNSIYERTHAN